MAVNPDLLAWLRAACAAYRFDVTALYRREADHDWPIEASDPEDLASKLDAGGHFLPLPREPAALANVLEVSILRFLMERAAGETGAEIRAGTERGYPDLELSGERFGSGFHAVEMRAQPDGAQRHQRVDVLDGQPGIRHVRAHRAHVVHAACAGPSSLSASSRRRRSR